MQRVFFRCCVLLGLLLTQGFVLSLLPASVHASPHVTQDPAQYINPLIGTDDSNAPNAVPGGAGGSTFPGAAYPFGMIQWSPDTPNASPSGYRYSDTTINGFSLTHFSGPGCANSADIPITPTVGSGNTNTSSTYSHSQESASAGYYGVTLANGVKSEMTVTQRTGMGRYTFPSTTNANIALDASRAATGTSNPSVTVTGTHEVSGQETSGNFCGAGNHYTIYFDVQFDRDFTVAKTWNGGVLVSFDTTSNPTINIKVGISYVGVNNARGNINAENTGWNFDGVKGAAHSAWNDRLNHLLVSGGTTDNLTKFYTALYHSLLHPNVFSDTNGEYIGFDNQIHTTTTTQYANYSGWDIYRSEIQLLSLFFPTEASDILKSLVNDAQQCGAFPKWAQNNSDTGVMVGDPDSIVVSSGYAFGATNFDTATALSYMIKSSTQPGVNCGGYGLRVAQNQYQGNGYIPYDNSPEWGGTSTTLEYSSADFAVAQFAKAQNDTSTYHSLLAHSTYWQNLFNTNTKYIQPRNQNGSWKGSFDPNSTDSYVEGNAAQYSWMVPYDPRTLFDKMGGNNTAVLRLDQFFTKLNAGLNDPNFYIGNEPNFATPWMYDWAQAPSHTQDVVRRVLDETFTTGPGGLPGNDDLGATSSWYVWGALGMYPEIPGVAGFALASPLFSSTTLTLGNGHTVSITANNAPSRYVQSMSLNGNTYNSPWLALNTISGGANISYALDTTASNWGTNANDAPPSYGPGTFNSVAEAFNNNGISSDTNTSAANFDGVNYSYSRDALSTQGATPGGTINAGGKTYIWPNTNAGTSDNVVANGQTINFSSPPQTNSIGFLGASSNGPVTGSGTVTYTDNSTATFNLGLSDWTLNGGQNTSPSYGETVALTTSYRNNITGKDTNKAHVFANNVSINDGKTVKSITLPSILNKGGQLHIFAISFGTTGGGGNTFTSGFENADTQPTWTNSVDNGGGPAGDIQNVNAICCGLSGPETGIRAESTHTGSNALLYSGLDNSSTTSYAYMKLFDVSSANLTVSSNTTLSYWIFPQSSSGTTQGANLASGSNSTCIAIDLIFSNNTNLRDSGATDQNGNRAHPAYQCNHLTLNSWNHVTVNLGSQNNGKTIQRIDLGYDQPANTGGYRGYIDDISIN
ncbi:alpha-1 2-mannosidase [Dictyobacter alpinus]|uniref:Alpha-1 2-mannosidase n=1 Tax=Dictyobacter alpinus TaxID=2014873 RepID=A0A402BD77_9CHLR|nr:GH92 family glycosyl hydrolase [Dictyobacter alpinus]GCE29232.1 alpha-1 2-mannosidase [Dictyobacter alpinus]